MGVTTPDTDHCRAAWPSDSRGAEEVKVAVSDDTAMILIKSHSVSKISNSVN